MHLGLVLHRYALCPGGFDIGEAQCPGMIGSADDDPAAMIDQVRFTEPRPILTLVGPSADRNLVLEQRAGLREAPRLSQLGTTAR